MLLAEIDPVVNLRQTLSVYRTGRNDPTTRLGERSFMRGTLTPDGPGTLRISWSGSAVDAEGWGPGGPWLLERASSMMGGEDPGYRAELHHHPVIRAAARNHPGVRIGASRTLYHELLPTILAQRVTGKEATRQWHQLCYRLGEPAPGPDPSLLLPPAPHRIAGKPAWWFHPFGIEAKRAEALRIVAKYAHRIGEWSALSPSDAAAKLSLLRGIGPWTIGSALGPALGDPDAVPVGDYHIPNTVSWALAGEPRGTDARMLELLEPTRGQRGRVIRLLGLDGHAAPAFGPRQRIQPMYKW